MYNIERQICESQGSYSFFVADIQFSDFEKDEANLKHICSEFQLMEENLMIRLIYLQ